MKRYYSAVKPFEKRKKKRPIFKLLLAIMRIFLPRDEFIWKTQKPKDGEAFIFVSNHTKIYAPLSFILNYEKPIRPWSNANLLTFKDVREHMFKNVVRNRKPKYLLYALSVLLSPLIIWFFRSLEVIPVYKKDRRIQTTFEKSIWTMEEGVHQIVFPEKLENWANKYIFELNQGFAYVAKEYYDKTNKIMKFYPVYVCKSLKKVLIGEPIAYNPDIHFKKQREQICRFLENGIKELGDSLPEHEIEIYE